MKTMHRFRAWADCNNIAYDENGYVNELVQNLYKPIDLNNRYQFKKGKGGEIDSLRPKLSALHSSSALFYNFLINYQYNSLALNKIFDLNIADEFLFKFEAQNSFRVHRSTAISNLDGEIYFLKDGYDNLIGIESKFLEPISHSVAVKRSYLVDKELSDNFPLSIKLLDDLFYKRIAFKHFSPEQIIKHWIGLKTIKDVKCTMIYVFYDNIGNGIDKEHVAEIDKFQKYVKTEISFKAIPFSTVLNRIKEIDNNHFNFLKMKYY